jgi:regulator of sirC expression with transglutaminase-like and TPR domain
VSRVLNRAPGDPVALADRALLRLEHGDAGVALPALRALASRPDELGERVRAEMAERLTPQ